MDNQLSKPTFPHNQSIASTNGTLKAASAPDSQTYGLDSQGMKNLGHLFRNLPVPQLIEHALSS